MNIQPNYQALDRIPSETLGIEVEAVFHTGESLPVKINLSGDVVSMDEIDTKVQLAKTLYLKMDTNNSEPLFKFRDDVEWKSILEAFTGSLNASLNTTSPKDLNFVGGLHLIMNQRI